MVKLIDTVKKHHNGDFSAAAVDYQKLLSDAPDSADILNLYGLCLTSLNQFNCAITLFTKAISLDPGQNEYLQNR